MASFSSIDAEGSTSYDEDKVSPDQVLRQFFNFLARVFSPFCQEGGPGGPGIPGSRGPGGPMRVRNLDSISKRKIRNPGRRIQRNGSQKN